jgi:P-type Cu+ transporter
METDPVCGMQVDPQQAAGHSAYQGRAYYFCSDACLRRFRAEPARYTATPATQASPGSATAAVWP